MLSIAYGVSKQKQEGKTDATISKALNVLLWVADMPNDFDKAFEEMREYTDNSIGMDKLVDTVKDAKEKWEKIQSSPMVSERIPADTGDLLNMLTSGEIKPATKEIVEKEVEFVLCASSENNMMRPDGAVDVPCSSCGEMVVLSPNSPKDKPCLCFGCGRKHMDGERVVKE